MLTTHGGLQSSLARTMHLETSRYTLSDLRQGGLLRPAALQAGLGVHITTLSGLQPSLKVGLHLLALPQLRAETLGDATAII